MGFVARSRCDCRPVREETFEELSDVFHFVVVLLRMILRLRQLNRFVRSRLSLRQSNPAARHIGLHPLPRLEAWRTSWAFN